MKTEISQRVSTKADLVVWALRNFFVVIAQPLCQGDCTEIGAVEFSIMLKFASICCAITFLPHRVNRFSVFRESLLQF